MDSRRWSLKIRFNSPFKVALLTNLLIRFEVFIHKVDGLSDDTKEFRQLHYININNKNF